MMLLLWLRICVKSHLKLCTWVISHTNRTKMFKLWKPKRKKINRIWTKLTHFLALMKLNYFTLQQTPHCTRWWKNCNNFHVYFWIEFSFFFPHFENAHESIYDKIQRNKLIACLVENTRNFNTIARQLSHIDIFHFSRNSSFQF